MDYVKSFLSRPKLVFGTLFVFYLVLLLLSLLRLLFDKDVGVVTFYNPLVLLLFIVSLLWIGSLALASLLLALLPRRPSFIFGAIVYGLNALAVVVPAALLIVSQLLSASPPEVGLGGLVIYAWAALSAGQLIYLFKVDRDLSRASKLDEVPSPPYQSSANAPSNP